MEEEMTSWGGNRKSKIPVQFTYRILIAISSLHVVLPEDYQRTDTRYPATTAVVGQADALNALNVAGALKRVTEHVNDVTSSLYPSTYSATNSSSSEDSPLRSAASVPCINSNKKFCEGRLCSSSMSTCTIPTRPGT